MNLLKIKELLEQKNMPTKWRKKIDIFIRKDGKLLVGYSPVFKTLLTPGGGIEEGQTIKQAAEIECKEELGVVISNFKLIPEAMFPLDYYTLSQDEQNLPKMKKRMKIYRGIKIFFGTADFVGWDKSLLGRDKDAMIPREVTKAELLKEFSKNKQPGLGDYKLKVLRKLKV